GAQPEIEETKLELHPREIRVVEEHTLERTDRRFVIAELRLDFRIAKGGVEVVRLDQHSLEEKVGLGPQIRLARRCRRRLRKGRVRSPTSKPNERDENHTPDAR